MSLRKEKTALLNNAHIYVVLDANVKDEDGLLRVACQSAEAGIGVFQIRAKQWPKEKILSFCEKAKGILHGKALFIVNDDPEIALEAGVDGVHLGQDDMSVDQARALVGDHMVIGVSCQNVNHAIKAQEDGADYIGLGSVFKTLTKPDRQPMDMHIIDDVLRCVTIPVFPIGGITLDNVAVLVEHGVRQVAVTRALCETDDVKGDVKKFQTLLKVHVS